MIMNTLSLGYQSCSFFLSICNDVQEVPSLRGKITSITCSWKKKHWNYLLSKGRISPILELKACQKKIHVSDIFILFPRYLTMSSLQFAISRSSFYFLTLTELSCSTLNIFCLIEGAPTLLGQRQKICWAYNLLQGKSNGPKRKKGQVEPPSNNSKPEMNIPQSFTGV